MIIYKASNLLNGKGYVGKTIKPLKVRVRNHKSENRDMSLFHKAIRKNSIDGFRWEVLCECDSYEILSIMETFLIMVHKTHVSEGGYNLTWGGEGSNGFHHTEKTKRLLREKSTGRIVSPELAERARLASIGVPKPGTAAFIKEKNTYWWEITKPSGERVVLRDMKNFCLENGLCQAAMSRVSQGKYKHHKGWKCRKMGRICNG